MHQPTRTCLARGIRVVRVLGFLIDTVTHLVDPTVVALPLRRRTRGVLGVVTIVGVDATKQATAGRPSCAIGGVRTESGRGGA